MNRNDYENLCARLAAACPSCDTGSDFSILCMSMNLSSKEADNRLYDDFGMSGEELLKALGGNS